MTGSADSVILAAMPENCRSIQAGIVPAVTLGTEVPRILSDHQKKKWERVSPKTGMERRAGITGNYEYAANKRTSGALDLGKNGEEGSASGRARSDR